jgi:hypothetical protein
VAVAVVPARRQMVALAVLAVIMVVAAVVEVRETAP